MGVVNDRQEPGAQPALLPKTPGTSDGADQRLLHQILGLVGAAREHQSIAPQHAEMWLDIELLEASLGHARYTRDGRR